MYEIWGQAQKHSDSNNDILSNIGLHMSLLYFIYFYIYFEIL